MRRGLNVRLKVNWNSEFFGLAVLLKKWPWGIVLFVGPYHIVIEFE